MHPIDKKNTILAGIFIGIAAILTIICFIKSPYYIVLLVVFGLIAFSNTMRIKHQLILLAVFISIGFPVYLVAGYLMSHSHLAKPDEADTYYLLSFVFASIVLIFPFVYTYTNYTFLIDTAINEKKHYDIIQNYPYIICKDHHTRTNEYSILGYKGVSCRVGKICLKNKELLAAVKLVGLIGVYEKGRVIDNDYYVTLWDHKLRKIRYGDYDIIEIHKNDEIKDYNLIFSKIINFFYNEIDRFKPINEVSIRFVGNVPISENTKRLLQNHFLKVEYFDV
jgi:hypothetical protein